MKLLISKERVRLRFYALFALLLLFLFLNYALLMPIPPIVYVCLLSFAALLGDLDEIISVCICCIPICTVVDWHYVVIFCIVILTLKYGRHIKLDLNIIPPLMIVIWEFLHCFSDEANIKRMISFALLYVFLIMLFSIRGMKMIDYSFIMRNLAFTVFGVCCILILQLIIQNNFNFELAFLDMQRLGFADEEMKGVIINPNSLGICCVLSIGGLMNIRAAGQKKMLDLLLMISILVFGALTGSRTYLVCLLILAVFMIMVSDRGIKGKIALLFGSVSVLLVAVMLLYLVFPSTLDMIAMRLTADDITGGRASLFAMYNDYLWSSPKAILWGIGSLDMAQKVEQLSISFNVPHNGIQEILVAWGIMGLLLFIAMILVLICRSRQENIHQSRTNYSLLVVIFAKIMAGQVITSSYTMLAFALVYLSLCWDLSVPKELEKSL